MRSKLNLVMVALMVLAVLAGCRPGATPTPTPAPPAPLAPAVTPPPTPAPTPVAVAPRPTGELRIALSALAGEVMDPTLTAGLIRVYLSPLYDFLVGATPDVALAPGMGLAEKWEVSHGPDSSIYTFYLRQGVKFHNGDEVTAEDVKFTLEYFMRPGSISSGASSLRAVIAKVEVAGPYKVVVRTKKPYGLLLHDLSGMSWVEGMVLPKKYIEEKGAEYFNRNPVGTGPYRFKEQKMGSYIIYEAVEKHWRVGVPKIKTLTLFVIPEETTRIAMLRVGQADIIDVSRERAKELKAAGFNLFLKPGSEVVGMRLGNTWQPDTYFYDKRVREAINLAINREELLKFVFEGQGEVVAHLDNHGSYAIGYKPLPLYPYDPERAKRLLREAFPEGVSLTIHSYPWAGVAELPRMSEAVAGMWGAVGVKTRVVPMADYASHRALIPKGIPNIAFPMAVANRPIWTVPYMISYHSTGLITTTKVPELDALIEAARKELDSAKLGERQFEVARFVRDNYLYVPMLEAGALYGANPKKVPQWDLGKLIYELNLEELYQRK